MNHPAQILCHPSYLRLPSWSPSGARRAINSLNAARYFATHSLSDAICRLPLVACPGLPELDRAGLAHVADSSRYEAVCYLAELERMRYGDLLLVDQGEKAQVYVRRPLGHSSNASYAAGIYCLGNELHLIVGCGANGGPGINGQFALDRGCWLLPGPNNWLPKQMNRPSNLLAIKL